MDNRLFSSIELRGLTLKNRLVVSPMCQYISENGSANDWHLYHLGNFSIGGFGLVMTEATNVNPVGKITHKCATLCTDENEAAMKRVIDFAKKFGVAAQGIQLAHAGRKGSTLPPALGGNPLDAKDGAWETVAPSAIPYAAGWHVPRALTRLEIRQLRDDFAASVQRAERVGYDLVEMHAGHGYLTHQFLSPLSNQRTDEYGGSLQNRMRFALETFEAMRAAWPKDRPMGARLSTCDWVTGGWTVEESVVFARELKTLGCDYIDVSSGGLHPAQAVPLAPAYHAEIARRIRKEVDIKVMVVGLIADPQVANDIIESGQADLVCMGRGAMWDPRFPWHAAEIFGAEAPYPARSTPCHPKLRPQLFPDRRQAAA